VGQVARIWARTLKEGDRSEDLGARERIILQLIKNTCCVNMWSGLNWLKIGSNDGHL
jgi:hypothetical protein